MGKKGKGRDPLKDIRSTRGKELDRKKVVLCVTGSVASIEVPSLARELMRHGADVNAVMSDSAEKLVRPETLEWATGNPVVRKLTGKTEHVRLAGEWEGRADLVLVAPCTANTISKMALGIDDTPVTTLASMALGGGIPLLVAPAAHEPMYRNPAVEANIQRLKDRGVEFVGPRFEEGKAKMATVGEIVDAAIRRLGKKDFEGRRIIVTGGPTAEFIDPVRVITNFSSGKMGVALAREAWLRGAEVSYIFGGRLAPIENVRSKRVVTTREMRDAALEELEKGKCDAFIMAAAPADFGPDQEAKAKIRTRDGALSLRLMPTPKIIDEVRKGWPKVYLVAFKAETAPARVDLIEAAKRFRRESGADIVVANDVSGGKAFATDTNSVLIVQNSGLKSINERSKNEIAGIVLDEVSRSLNRTNLRKA
ncbi:MAG TPA: bifunctional phosphopantothenoylcysteine decarboxylase/phosphopantothenate--cysteine ligase CoaBC [Nitrososphaerales archaeon]|nr:bifunctional phosphopantothenoylcysteine decarboxylase/phosphopantothenate--cysteine ligase CoaBC [Nitrososphaerales archaeon]